MFKIYENPYFSKWSDVEPSDPDGVLSQFSGCYMITGLSPFVPTYEHYEDKYYLISRKSYSGSHVPMYVILSNDQLISERLKILQEEAVGVELSAKEIDVFEDSVPKALATGS